MNPTIRKIFGKELLSSTEAAKYFGITNDYVTVLCRSKKVKGVFVGRLWFVDQKSLESFLSEARTARETRRQMLSQQLREEYHRVTTARA